MFSPKIHSISPLFKAVQCFIHLKLHPNDSFQTSVIWTCLSLSTYFLLFFSSPATTNYIGLHSLQVCQALIRLGLESSSIFWRTMLLLQRFTGFPQTNSSSPGKPCLTAMSKMTSTKSITVDFNSLQQFWLSNFFIHLFVYLLPYF